MLTGSITDVPGIKVGHVENPTALTGCTVILTEKGATAGVDVRGSAPGTKETDVMDPLNAVEKVHGICLTGGSTFGLDAASGVMQYLEENGIGLDLGVATIPIVPSAVLFDLAVGDCKTRPDRHMGYEAARAATTDKVKEGNVGAGCGATVGKMMGISHCMKGGLGSASMELANGLRIGAIVAVNAMGDVRDPHTGKILAGPYDAETGKITDSLEYMKTHSCYKPLPGTNTTIGAVAVNADLTKAEAKKIAQMAHNGLARTIFPVHTMSDGDTIFALGTGGGRASVDLIGTMAAVVMAEAIMNAIKQADGVLGIQAYKNIKR